MSLDELKTNGIELYMHEGALRFRGPEGSKDRVVNTMRDRVHKVLVRAGHRRPVYADAMTGFGMHTGYGKCELCGSKMEAHRSGTCIFCVEVVRRAVLLDADARLVVLDTETTGLNPSMNGVIEVGCIVMERDCSAVFDSYESRMPIHPKFAVHPRALEVNGYTPEKWADASPHAEVYAKLDSMIRPQDILIGWNMSFDVNFLHGTANMLGISPLPLLRWVDAKSVLEPVLRGRVKNMKLVTVTEHLGIDHTKAHTAMGDVEPLVEVWKWFLKQEVT